MIIKRLLFLSLFLVAPGIAHAACPSPFVMKDAVGAGAAQNIATMNDASNNCVFEGAAAIAVPYIGTLQSGAGASGNGTAMTVTGTSAAAITVNCSACSGGTTINFEGQEDGSNFRPIIASPSDGSAPATTTTAVGFTDWYISTAGFQQIRARISAYVGGTITVTAHAFAVPVALPSTTVYQGGSPWGANVGGLAASGATASGNPLKVGGVFNTTQPTVTNGQAVDAQTTNRGEVLVATGVNPVAASQSGTWTVQPGNTANTTPWLTQNVTGATGGASTCFLSSGASTNATNCKASAGNVYMHRPLNTTTTTYFLRMYNLATPPTCSSATGYIETIPVPPTVASGVGGLVAEQSFGQAYSTGIAFCLTGGGSSTDNSNAATGVYISILYK